eukprot:snap_masked-scaffold_1-processed-gene-22.49-mRNA-1 protein AED:1.00 eAED:1.00 QI:0/-1/0/0/-1/1/1/0/115
MVFISRLEKASDESDSRKEVEVKKAGVSGIYLSNELIQIIRRKQHAARYPFGAPRITHEEVSLELNETQKVQTCKNIKEALTTFLKSHTIDDMDKESKLKYEELMSAYRECVEGV